MATAETRVNIVTNAQEIVDELRRKTGEIVALLDKHDAKLAVLRLSEDDTVLLTVEEELPREEITDLSDAFMRISGHDRVIVVSGGITTSIIRQDGCGSKFCTDGGCMQETETGHYCKYRRQS